MWEIWIIGFSTAVELAIMQTALFDLPYSQLGNGIGALSLTANGYAGTANSAKFMFGDCFKDSIAPLTSGQGQSPLKKRLAAIYLTYLWSQQINELLSSNNEVVIYYKLIKSVFCLSILTKGAYDAWRN